MKTKLFPLAIADMIAQSNACEYVTGTVPTNGASHFQITLNDIADQPTRKLLTFSPRLRDRTYTIQFRIDLSSGSFSNLTTATQSDNGTIRTITDTNTAPSSKFYRVGITFP